MLAVMGNREDLLTGAKRCLIEKGYARTTARDIAAASGVSLAAIGYHFGSKDALMNQAVFESVGDWADELEKVMTAEGRADATALERFELIMRQTLASFEGPNGGLWTAQLELLSLAQHNQELHDFLAGIQDLAESGLAELFLGISAADDPESARAAGTVLQALFIGLIAKHYLGPPGRLTGERLAEGMRIIAERMAPPPAT